MLRVSNDGRKGVDEETDKGKCKGKSTFSGDKTPHYMFDADELPSQPMHDEQTDADPNPVVPRDEQELYKAQKKAKERKDHLWQLLLQRNTVQAIPTGQVVVAPCYMPVLDISIQRTFLRKQPYWSKSGYHGSQKRKTHRKHSKHSTW